MRIRVERLADQLVGDVGAVEVAGVDVIDPTGHRLPQHGERRPAILGRPEDAGPGKLHRAIAHAVDGAVAEREGAGGGDVDHGMSPKLNRPEYGLSLSAR